MAHKSSTLYTTKKKKNPTKKTCSYLAPKMHWTLDYLCLNYAQLIVGNMKPTDDVTLLGSFYLYIYILKFEKWTPKKFAFLWGNQNETCYINGDTLGQLTQEAQQVSRTKLVKIASWVLSCGLDQRWEVCLIVKTGGSLPRFTNSSHTTTRPTATRYAPSVDSTSAATSASSPAGIIIEGDADISHQLFSTTVALLLWCWNNILLIKYTEYNGNISNTTKNKCGAYGQK